MIDPSRGASVTEKAFAAFKDDSRLRPLIENALDIITLLDEEGRAIYNSPSIERVLGYGQDELNGRVVFELVHPLDLPAVMDVFERGVRSPGVTDYVEYRLMHKDGTWIFFESVGNNLLSDPAVRGIVVNSHDITERKRVEEELRRSEEHFRAVAENAMDIIAIIDAEAKIVYANKASRRVLGYEPEEMVGRSSFDFIHPEDAGWAADTMETVLADPDYSPIQTLRVRHKDGTWRYLESIGKNYLDLEAVHGIVLSFHDVTDLRRAEEELRDSEEMYRTLVGISPEAVTVSDLEGRITYVSPQTLRMHGYGSEEELIGRSALVFIDPEDHERATSIWQKTLNDGAVRNVEFTAMRKGGERFLAELNAALIRDARGEPKSLVAFTREISERKRIERELRERNEELEAFAHTISHDLLTPVAIVEGYAKAALEADAEGRAESERECLEAIARGAQRMSDLINSLLQYAQAGHVDAEYHGVDPEEVLMEVLMDLEEEISSRRARVEIEGDLPQVTVNDVKLRQVLYNLIGNALKHMGDSHEPLVKVGAKQEGGTATFYVRDNGMGLPAELHDKVFEPFRHFSLAGSQGLGIGLSTVKRAVKAWGGRVWVESTPGEGACFFFTAPIAGG